MPGVELVYMRLGKLHVDGAGSSVGFTDIEFDCVSQLWVGVVIHISYMDEDVVGLSLNIDEAEATIIEPASNCSFH
jgi:hypothetical protein